MLTIIREELQAKITRALRMRRGGDRFVHRAVNLPAGSPERDRLERRALYAYSRVAESECEIKRLLVWFSQTPGPIRSMPKWMRDVERSL